MTRPGRREPTRRGLTRRLVLWGAGSAVGGAVIALPDSDDRVFSISRLHGPSPVDLAGALVVVGCWLPTAAVLVPLARRCRPGPRRTAAALGVLGTTALAVTVLADLGWWWVPAALAVLAAQVVLLVAAWGSVPAPPAPPAS